MFDALNPLTDRIAPKLIAVKNGISTTAKLLKTAATVTARGAVGFTRTLTDTAESGLSNIAAARNADSRQEAIAHLLYGAFDTAIAGAWVHTLASAAKDVALFLMKKRAGQQVALRALGPAASAVSGALVVGLIYEYARSDTIDEIFYRHIDSDDEGEGSEQDFDPLTLDDDDYIIDAEATEEAHFNQADSSVSD